MLFLPSWRSRKRQAEAGSCACACAAPYALLSSVLSLFPDALGRIGWESLPVTLGATPDRDGRSGMAVLLRALSQRRKGSQRNLGKSVASAHICAQCISRCRIRSIFPLPLAVERIAALRKCQCAIDSCLSAARNVTQFTLSPPADPGKCRCDMRALNTDERR
jgi:hypothetical protein